MFTLCTHSFFFRLKANAKEYKKNELYSDKDATFKENNYKAYFSYFL